MKICVVRRLLAVAIKYEAIMFYLFICLASTRKVSGDYYLLFDSATYLVGASAHSSWLLMKTFSPGGGETVS